MNEAAATPAPGPPRLDALLAQATAEVASARRVLEEDIRLRGEMPELMAGWHRLAELEAAIRNAAVFTAAGDARPAVQQAPEAARPRHRRPRRGGGERSLFSVPGIPAAAFRAAAAGVVVAGLTGGVVAGMHDESSVRYAAARPAGHPALHRMAPDRAAAIPPPSWSPSPSPRPSAAAATASPVPRVTPSPSGPASSPSPAPVPSVTAAAPPALDIQRFLDLGAVTRGPLTITAGSQSVTWTVTATDGITVSENGAPATGGTLTAGQELALTVAAPLGGGVIHFWVGTDVFTVVVSSDVGAPALALR